ncbi:MAG: GrpB family protein [Chloroflexota bacterium]|nr:GrpB family protein [Chloroflexota bacterium]
MADVKNAIVIQPSDPHWPGEFQRIALPLRAALGDRALRLDHIGSTAVPGLAAKDVIDVQVTVAALDSAAISAALAPLAYTPLPGITGDHLPPGRAAVPAEWAKLLFREPVGERRVNLHIRQAGRANQRYALLFRDYLRADPGAAAAYGQIKTALAQLHPNDVEAYYDVKDPVCDLIIAAAELWATATGYTPGPSDQ